MGDSLLYVVGLRPGCVMSPWFFNILYMYMDGVVREGNARVLRSEIAKCGG